MELNRGQAFDSAIFVDTYSAATVSRLYDAENRTTKETQASNYVAGIYSYDSDGRRVKRVVGDVETWQVYGLGGELIAEYAANTAASSPQKEYGYRNGQLLITTTCGSGYGAPPTLHDNPLVVGETSVQARHITELRTAINALREREGMGAYSWQTSATTSDWITAGPIAEMRTALDQAIGPPPSGYSSGLAQGQPIKAIHIQELRDRLTAAWSIDIRWFVSDQLGTPRMIFDASGSLLTVSRHDYLPFGEELFAGIAGRTVTQGYSLGDGAR
jgi:YD repeat-containing protein